VTEVKRGLDKCCTKSIINTLGSFLSPKSDHNELFSIAHILLSFEDYNSLKIS